MNLSRRLRLALIRPRPNVPQHLGKARGQVMAWMGGVMVALVVTLMVALVMTPVVAVTLAVTLVVKPMAAILAGMVSRWETRLAALKPLRSRRPIRWRPMLMSMTWSNTTVLSCLSRPAAAWTVA